MEAVGQLAGGIAHDFNNILTAIMSSGELLKMKIGSGNPLKTYVEYIMDASNRGASLVKKLLAFSRKEAFYPVTANLNEIIEGIGPLIKKIVPEDIDIHITPSHEVLTVMADRSLIEQVIINLVANSRDAMPSGGVISIGTGIMKLDDTFTGTHADLSRGEYAVVTVSDTGAGMDERTRERIFEPFFTTKEVGKGTGLGLSSAYGIIKQHNGGIHAHSTAGIGTTMTILLPLVHAAGEVTETEEAALPPGGNETILLVEDDPIVRGVTQSLLKEFGYTVIVAADGADAITLFAENKDKIRLALLDMIMPRMNGKEAYEFMKKMAPDIKTIFMSGYAEDILKTRSIIEDGLQYISKPVSPVELLTMVRKVLDEEI
jgi:two-component system cell cycle sensor histidine kinase/response regulator CckA